MGTSALAPRPDVVRRRVASALMVATAIAGALVSSILMTVLTIGAAFEALNSDPEPMSGALVAVSLGGFAVSVLVAVGAALRVALRRRFAAGGAVVAAGGALVVAPTDAAELTVIYVVLAAGLGASAVLLTGVSGAPARAEGSGGAGTTWRVAGAALAVSAVVLAFGGVRASPSDDTPARGDVQLIRAPLVTPPSPIAASTTPPPSVAVPLPQATPAMTLVAPGVAIESFVPDIGFPTSEVFEPTSPRPRPGPAPEDPTWEPAPWPEDVADEGADNDEDPDNDEGAGGGSLGFLGG